MAHELLLATSPHAHTAPGRKPNLYAGTTPDGALRNHTRQCGSWPITFQRITCEIFETDKLPGAPGAEEPGSVGMISYDYQVVDELPLTELFGERYPDIDAYLAALGTITGKAAEEFTHTEGLRTLGLEASALLNQNHRHYLGHCANEAFFKYHTDQRDVPFEKAYRRLAKNYDIDWYAFRALPTALAGADLLDDEQTEELDRLVKLFPGG